jgi:hypothetical protein
MSIPRGSARGLALARLVGAWAAGGGLVPGCLCARPAETSAPIAALWAAGDGEAVARDARPPRPGPLLWDGQRVQLHAAGNEIVAFQLIVRAGREGIVQLRAQLPELVGPGSPPPRLVHRPPGPDPSDFRGRDIQIFSVGYQTLRRASRADWIYHPDGPDAPRGGLGSRPVQLVPENARAGRGGFPLAVPGGQTQALWIEVYTGRDRPPGRYRGTVTVTADGQRAQVPVELELLAFSLPDRSPLTAMLYYESAQPRLYQGRDLDAVYHRFAHRQRVELVHGYDLESARAALGRFDGRDFAAPLYEGPGQGVGNRIVPASFYGPGPGWDDRAAAWARADAWMSFLGERLPGAITFLYMPDEPPPEQFPFIRALADTVRANPGPGRRLPTLVTRPFTPELAGAIDIWCSTAPDFDRRQAAEQRAAGRAWWLYNGGRPAGPALVIEAPPSDARVIGWAAFAAEVPVYFWWHAVHWRHNHQKKVGDRNQNVWADPVTFDARSPDGAGDFANGEGVLMYPGTDRLHPDQDRGIEGPISTLRLANLRRGLQDHLYLTLARERGHHALVEQALSEIVPVLFSEARGPVRFAQTTDAFERVRLRLGRALAGDGSLPPGPDPEQSGSRAARGPD